MPRSNLISHIGTVGAWTSKQSKNNIFEKQQAGKQLGYLYEIWIYDSKGTLLERHL